MRREICKFKTGSKKVLPADSAVALSPPDPSNYRHGRPTSGYSANAPRPLGEREGGVGKKIQNCYRRHIWTVPCANFEHEVERDSQVDVVDDAGGVDGLEAPLGLPLDDGAGHDERNVDDDEEEGEDAEGDLPGWQFNRQIDFGRFLELALWTFKHFIHMCFSRIILGPFLDDFLTLLNCLPAARGTSELGTLCTRWCTPWAACYLDRSPEMSRIFVSFSSPNLYLLLQGCPYGRGHPFVDIKTKVQSQKRLLVLKRNFQFDVNKW